MRLENQRESQHVERRRGGKGKRAAMGGGLGAIIMAIIAIFVMKQPASQVIGQMVQNQNQGPQSGPSKALSPRQEAIDKFVRQVKGSTEEVWTQLFRQAGAQYRIPKLINYDGMTRMKTGGVADSRMGPFYVPDEETIYIDTSFFDQMDRDLGGGGDFAYAYVIAHEVGHHIQKLTGKTSFVHNQRKRLSQAEYNRLSVRLELQADFYAGVWAHHANQQKRRRDGRNLLEEGDIQEAMRSASAIGDDTLQRKAGQRERPETFSHGTSEQRMRWFIKGIRSGDVNQGDTFNIPYSQL